MDPLEKCYYSSLVGLRSITSPLSINGSIRKIAFDNLFPHLNLLKNSTCTKHAFCESILSVNLLLLTLCPGQYQHLGCLKTAGIQSRRLEASPTANCADKSGRIAARNGRGQGNRLHSGAENNTPAFKPGLNGDDGDVIVEGVVHLKLRVYGHCIDLKLLLPRLNQLVVPVAHPHPVQVFGVLEAVGRREEVVCADDAGAAAVLECPVLAPDPEPGNPGLGAGGSRVAIGHPSG